MKPHKYLNRNVIQSISKSANSLESKRNMSSPKLIQGSLFQIRNYFLFLIAELRTGCTTEPQSFSDFLQGEHIRNSFFLLGVNKIAVEEGNTLQSSCDVLMAVTKHSKFGSETAFAQLFLSCYMSLKSFFLLMIKFRETKGH